jgi:hypothetical protein
MYGAREGCYLTNCTDWDYSQVRDFEYLTEQWDNYYCNKEVFEEVDRLGRELRNTLGLEIAELDKIGSEFFKRVYHNTPRITKRKKL